MNYSMKFYLLIITTSFLLGIELLDNSMNINFIPKSAESSAMGGVYIPNESQSSITFSHLSNFGGIYELDAIQYNNFLFAVHGVDNIPNTLAAWVNIDEDGPDANEINYSKISYFDAKDYNFIFSKVVRSKYNISVKNTLSKIYNHFGIGIGVNLLTTKRTNKWFDYYLGVYDLLSFKNWFNNSSSSYEIYEPKLMFSLEKRVWKSLNILTLYGFYKNNKKQNFIDYRLGSKINVANNLDILIGKSTFNKLSIGFVIFTKLFRIDYSYIISNQNSDLPDSYNIGIAIKIPELIKKSKDFYP